METPTSVYNLIAQYDLSGDEQNAIIYGSIFLKFCRKLFPDCKINGFGQSDPRKSLLFKCCYGMIREVKGKIDPTEMDLYIYSQLAVLKANNSADTPVLLTPQVLCGAKAQWRWKFYNKQAKIQLPQIQKHEVVVDQDKIKKSIDKSLEFLHQKIIPFTKENFFKKLDDNSIARWYENNFICGWYITQCYIVKEWLKDQTLSSVFGPGIKIYE